MFKLKRRDRKCSRKEDVLSSCVVLKFVLMNHKYCERFHGKFEKDLGKITSPLWASIATAAKMSELDYIAGPSCGLTD